MTNNLLEAALKYANQGWYVVPLYGNEGSNCECGKQNCKSPGKHPRIAEWRKAASIDPDVISDWWRKRPNSNIGT